MLPKPSADTIFQPLPDGAVLFAPRTELYFGLNTVGAAVWSLLPPVSSSLEELCGRLAESYPDVAPEEIRRDVVELLDDLVREGLADAQPGAPDDASQAA